MNTQTPAAYKAIFTFQDFTHEVSIPNLSLQISIGDFTKIISLPFREGILFEIKELQLNSRAQFQLEDREGDIVGYAELRIPSSVFTSSETEVNQQVQFQLVKGPKTSFLTNVSVIFITRKEKTSVAEALRLQELRTISASPSKKILQDVASPKRSNTIQQPQRLADIGSPTAKNQPKKEFEQDPISQLIQLNRNEKNLPNSFFDDSALLQLQIELESPSKSPVEPNSNTRSKFKRSETLSVNTDSKDKEKKRVTRSKETSPGPLFRTQISMLDTKKFSPTETTEKVKSALKKTFSDPIDLTDDKSLIDIIAMMEKDLGGQRHYKSYLEYIKNRLLTMEFKNNELETLRNEHEGLKQDVQRLEEDRAQAKDRSAGTVNSLKQENEALRKKIDSLFAQNETLNTKNNELQNEVIKSKDNANKMSLSLIQREKELSEASIKVAELTEIKYHLKRAQDALVRGEEQRGDDQKNYMEALEKLRRSLEENKLLLEKTFQEKRELALQLAQEKFAHQDSKNELSITEKKLQTAEAYKETVKSLEAQREEMVKQLTDSRSECDEVHKLMEKTQNNLSSKMREFETKESEYIRQVTVAEESNRVTEVKNSGLNKDINTANMKILKLSAEVLDAEDQLADKDRISEEAELIRGRLAQAIEDRMKITKGVDSLTSNHELMSQKTFDLEKTKDALINIIAEKDQEIMGLRDALEILNQPEPDLGPKYVAAKDDFVDMALANFLNSSKDAAKYKALFLREAEGVYQFGTKKIYIKIEGDKILIRVGGGYMTLEELLETIAPGEFAKIIKYAKSEDPNMRAIAKNVAISKVLDGKSPLEKTKHQVQKLTKLNKVLNAFKGELGSPTAKDLKDAFSPKSNRPPV